MPKVEIFQGDWTRAEVQKDKQRLYLFGDNIADQINEYIPSKTQAVIRGLFNAVGIPTKKQRGYDDSAYFWDTEEDFALFKDYVDKAIYLTKIRCEKYGHTIVIPSGGIGTGRATTRGVFSIPGNRFKAYLDGAIASLGKPIVNKNLIRIVNMKMYAAMPGERLIRIDRQSPIGNPFPMRNQSKEERDRVCDAYETYFRDKVSMGDDDKFIDYLFEILECLKKGQKVALGCWCVPLRCHGLTIKAWLEEQLSQIQEMTNDTFVEAILNQVRETGEWVAISRGEVTVEALRYGSPSKGRPETFYIHHPGEVNFGLSEASARRYIEKHR